MGTLDSPRFQFPPVILIALFKGTWELQKFLWSLSPAYSDMFLHKHAVTGKFPFPIPPIPGWDPDTNPWDDYLYPPLNPKPKELQHRRGK